MARRKNRPSSPSALPAVSPTPSTPWYKRLWVVVTAVGTLAFTLGLNGPTLLQNLRKLPSEIETTRDQYLSWLKEDAAWTGNWSTFPEGVVNMGDMRLSEGIDLKITVHARHGKLDGTIASGRICANVPVFDFLLLRGPVTGNTAIVEVWDIIGGHSRVFERLKLVREHDVITVHTEAGDRSWFPAGARLGRHPAMDESFMRAFCGRSSNHVVPR